MAGSFDEILADAKVQISALQDTERRLSDEIESIRAQNPQAPLTNQEKAQLADLRSCRDAVLDSIEVVALVTLERLDNTVEVKSLAPRIRAAGQSLRNTTNKIRKIGALAQTLSNLLDGASALEAKIANLEKVLGK